MTSRPGWTPIRGSRRELPAGTPLDQLAKLLTSTSVAKRVSPIGTSVSQAVEAKRSRSSRYQEARDRLQPFEELARVVIVRRGRLGLSQQDLAKRMGTTASVISRIESGQHRTSTETLRRLAEALGGRAVVGFEFGTPAEPDQELVQL